MTTMTASPAKLRNGSWGARVRSESVHPGDVVTITTKAGKSWTATVERVLWHGDGVSLCATASEPRHGRDADCCGYPCPVTGRRCTPRYPCHDCC